MKTRIGAALLGIVGAAFIGVVLVPGEAFGVTCPTNTACGTTTTFVVSTGTLQITVPDSTVALANSGPPGGYAYGHLGPVTVTDNRASLSPTWSASASSTDFTTGSGSSPETVTAGNIYYHSGDATATFGNGTFMAGQPGVESPPPPVIGVSLDSTRTAFSHTGGSSNNWATWDPFIQAIIATTNVGGIYTGTITHTVS